MSARSDVLLWAQRVLARKGQPAHVLLELRADCTADDAQAAFHKVARTAHPDLHRTGLSAEELELLTSAYATVAGAYQELRSKTAMTTRMKPVARPDDLALAATPPVGNPTVGAQPATPPRGTQTARPAPAATAPAATAPAAPGTRPEQAMSSKAIVYYRKAELALKRGDLKGAILQLKLACATDPASQFLRTALAEVETEVRKNT